MIKRLLRLIFALQIYVSVELIEEGKYFLGNDLYFLMSSFILIFGMKFSYNLGRLLLYSSNFRPWLIYVAEILKACGVHNVPKKPHW